MTSKKEYVILSASEISHNHSDKAYTLRKFTLPGVDSTDETGGGGARKRDERGTGCRAYRAALAKTKVKKIR